MRRRSRRAKERGLANRLVLAVLFASCCLACESDGKWRHRTFAPPRVFHSNYSFAHDRAESPKIVALRLQEDLDSVVKGCASEHALFEALTLWTRRQFEPGIPDPYPLSNGLDILADIRSGKTGGFCGQYSYLLADALKSLGFYDVRYVETFSGHGDGHFLVEVWDNETGRWLLLDPLSCGAARGRRREAAFELGRQGRGRGSRARSHPPEATRGRRRSWADEGRAILRVLRPGCRQPRQ